MAWRLHGGKEAMRGIGDMEFRQARFGSDGSRLLNPPRSSKEPLTARKTGPERVPLPQFLRLDAIPQLLLPGHVRHAAAFQGFRHSNSLLAGSCISLNLEWGYDQVKKWG